MIGRIWHGYTTFANADEYEKLLMEEIFVNIQEQNILGFQEIQLFRRPLENEVEFITIIWFDSLESVKAFAGEDYQTAVVPPKARGILSHFDESSQHYEVIKPLKNQLKC
jgi:heme-degrading monooxygenase HmoA